MAVYKCIFLAIFCFSFMECQTHINLNSTVKRYMENIGKEMFGFTKSTVEPFGPGNTEEPWWNMESIEMKEDEEKKKKVKKRRKKKRIERLKLYSMGPPGPPGPAGKPGSDVTVFQLMSDMRKMLRSTAVIQKVKSSSNKNQPSRILSPGVADAIIGFASLTRRSILVPSRSIIELHDFEIKKPGSFQRGSSFDANTGHFVAPISAVYSFLSVIHISIPRDLDELVRKDYLTVSICIDGDFQNKRAIKVTEGMGSNSRIFSIDINGHLFLQTGQLVSIYIYNNSHQHNIVVLKNSYFSGILVGT